MNVSLNTIELRVIEDSMKLEILKSSMMSASFFSSENYVLLELHLNITNLPALLDSWDYSSFVNEE